MPVLPRMVSILVTFQSVYIALFLGLGGLCVDLTLCMCSNFFGM